MKPSDITNLHLQILCSLFFEYVTTNIAAKPVTFLHARNKSWLCYVVSHTWSC